MLNKTYLFGRLTKDPEIRRSGATTVATFYLAIPRGYGENAQVDYPRCTAFGKTADFLDRYVMQGHQVLLECHIQTGSYKNKDGKKIYTTDVIVDRLVKPAGAKAQEKEEAPAPKQAEWEDISDDGLPFH